jgi:hypothetical protein
MEPIGYLSQKEKKKKEYSCDKCNKIFDKKSKYSQHMNRKTSCVIPENYELTELVGEDRNYGGNDLFIDLIPKNCWFSNVRTSIKYRDWNRLRKYVYKRVDYKCECCNFDTKENDTRLEAHERWYYDETNKTQKLMRIIALCNLCHLSTHLGYAHISGRGDEAINHLMKVRKFTQEEFQNHRKEAFELWRQRNTIKWSLDLSLITNNNIELIKKYTEGEREDISEKKLDEIQNTENI